MESKVVKVSIKLLSIVVLVLMAAGTTLAQTGVIKGRVYNSLNNEPVPFASILIDSTQIGTASDIDGNYVLPNLKPGTYNLICSFIGFKKAMFYEIIVSQVKPTTLDIAMEEEASTLNEVEIRASPFKKFEESPVSLRTISASEIYRNPGGNRDISKVIQVLPGVASTVSFRNDIIVRGGAPSENRFYLDGIEVPNINHFATQGSSGGPVGMINVNFIREVDFYSGAFPANRGNALSSVIEFKQISGNTEKLTGTFMLGSSDIGITLDGPSGDKSSFILSARRSYLQFLFKALKLPFLPTYNDFQYKHEFRINNKNKITLIGLGAIDDFELNTTVNDGETDPEVIERNDYLLGNLPVNTQWNYAIGANWTHFSKNSNQTLVISRNMLSNKAEKYQNNIEDPANLLLNYESEESENKLRFENNMQFGKWKWNIGAGYENVLYRNSTFNKTVIADQPTTINYDSKLRLNKFSIFTQASTDYLSGRLTLSVGLRTDFNDYDASMANPLDQLSPRLSVSYAITDKLNVSANVARYSQLPAYTVLGYRDSTDNLVNKENDLSYIYVDHYVGGFEYSPTAFSKITVEGFLKNYSNYPFLLRDSISLANLGGDFGVIGNEPVSSISKGRSYGVELLMQQKLASTVYGIVALTWVRSEFQDKNGVYIPSAWDNRYILNLTAGKKFKKNWEFGLRFRLQGGNPYTPYDVEVSSQKAVWDVTQQGVLDYNRLNTERNPMSNGLDVRVDKKWFFDKWLLNIYLDIQNIYNFKVKNPDYLDVRQDEFGVPVTDPNNPNNYILYGVENISGTVLPSVGIMIEF